MRTGRIIDRVMSATIRKVDRSDIFFELTDKQGRIAYKAMWTDHSEIQTVLDNLVLADELAAQGVRLKPSYTEKINYIPAEYAGGVREKVFGRAGQKAWEDYRRTFGG
jgi:hypothetical protein